MKKKSTESSDFRAVILEIYKQAFWGDYSFTPEEIEKIIKSRQEKDEYLKFIIWQKAFFNLREPWMLTHVFSHNDIKKFLLKTRIQQPFEYLTKRIRMWRNIFLNEKNEVEGIEWKYFS